MNDFEFILEDIIFKKKITLTEDEYYDLRLALSCASHMFGESKDIQNRKKSRELLKLEDKIKRC